MQIDPNYTAGMSWDRAFGLRVTKNMNNKVWFGFALENSQVLLTSSGAAGNFLIGGPGTGGGLYNQFANYSTNVAPDIIAKIAFEPGFGHYEIYGLASEFRERLYPNATAAIPSAAGAHNSSIWGGGWGANARWMFYQKHIEVGLHGMGGKGIGRYGDTTLADLTTNPNGNLKALQNYQVLASLEWHSPKWDVYGYGGGEYDGKTWYLNSAGKPVGYGSPLASNLGCGTETIPGTGAAFYFPAATSGFAPGALATCTGNTKSIVEGTTGFWYKPYNGPKGRFQLGMQYSYLVRTAWVGYGLPPYKNLPGSSTLAPKAIENMWFTSVRYYLP
jgi:hypothetical protein